MNSWSKNLELLIKSRASLIWIKTKEEERLENKLNIICERLNIHTKLIKSSSLYGIEGVKDHRLISICKNIQITTYYLVVSNFICFISEERVVSNRNSYCT